MRHFFQIFLFVSLFASINVLYAQTTVTSGNWTDPTVWSGGSVPIASGTVTVDHPLNIGSDLAPTGVWTFNSNTTDQPGGTEYKFEPNAGTNAITISSGVTVVFNGGTAGPPGGNTNEFSSGTIDIYGTLVLGYTTFKNSANLNITIHSGGTLIVNGDLIVANNSGTFVVSGALIVNGTLNVSTGSVTVGGAGSIDTTGPITSNGGSTIFGSTNDCTTGPCSGTTLSCTFTNTISPSSKAICSGTTAGTLTVTTNATSPTYQWKSSTDNITYSNASGTSTNSTYVTPSLTQTTWYKVTVTSSAPCTSTSAAVKVTVLPSTGGWIGSTSTAWNTSSNWCSASVPTSTVDVVITNASGISNLPVIAAGTTASCNNLTVSSTFPATSLTLVAAATNSLNIYGNLTNNGTFTDNTTSSAAGVKFVGGAVQTIAGSTANLFNNLTIANTSGGTPAINITTNNVTVRNNLTMTSGLINLNGYTVILGTSAGSTGTVNFTAGRFYGGNIQRWFPTASVTIPAAAGLFPIGTSTDYRPIYFGNAGLSAGGTIKVRHTGVVGATAVSPTFVDNGGTVAVRSNSFWTVTTANGIGTGTHTIRTEGTGFGTVAVVTDLRQTLVNSISPGSDGAHAGTTSNPQVNRTGLTTANLSNSFYWGSIDPTNTPLPVELVNFTATSLNNAIELNWETAIEFNNDYFEVERSSDGEEYSSMIRIKGNGTVNQGQTYKTTDMHPRKGISYYRLKQVDFDGSVEYSKAISVLYDGPSLAYMNVYPNPSLGNEFTIELFGFEDKEIIPVVIVDNMGREFANYELRTNNSNGYYRGSIILDKPLPKGIYIIKSGQTPNLLKRVVVY